MKTYNLNSLKKGSNFTTSTFYSSTTYNLQCTTVTMDSIPLRLWRYLSNTRKYREFHVNKVWSIESCLSNIDIPVYISKRKVEDQMNLTYRRVFPLQRVLCKISDVCHLWLLFKSFSKRWHLLYMQSFCFWRSIQSMIGSRSDKQKIIKPSLNLIPQRKWKGWKKNNFWNLQEEKWHREHIKCCSHFKIVEQRTFCSMKPDWSLKDEEKSPPHP